MSKQIHILAIETSCDETAASVVTNGREVKSNVIYSQIAIHQKFGGVVPEVASRKHIEHIAEIVTQALEEAKLTPEDLDAVAVTKGPGLIGALLVGVSYAKALSFGWRKPLIGVNHLHGHISANFISHPQLEPPFLCLIVSGGHTHLLDVKSMNEMVVIGGTRDDAAGEAFDKVARALKLPYPGGPQIDRLSKEGDIHSISWPKIKLKEAGYDFSFSGLKSAVLNYLNQANQKNQEIFIPDIAASFQYAVAEQLSDVTFRAIKEKGYKNLVLAGGVSANSVIRKTFEERCKEEGISFYCPELRYCTDNGAMIGAAAYHQYLRSDFEEMSLNACAQIESL